MSDLFGKMSILAGYLSSFLLQLNFVYETFDRLNRAIFLLFCHFSFIFGHAMLVMRQGMSEYSLIYIAVVIFAILNFFTGLEQAHNHRLNNAAVSQELKNIRREYQGILSSLPHGVMIYQKEMNQAADDSDSDSLQPLDQSKLILKFVNSKLLEIF
mmetsp:Transcript_14630/g.22670  ORF Transcript_14630/g.22670 Transcript_14630/m.22670 type:complete len:156 (-) Transcript_14630:4490-4957(-)